LVKLEGELWHGIVRHPATGPLILRELPDAAEVEIHFELADVRRGFIESLRIRGADWIEHAEKILRLNPVRKVSILMGAGWGWPSDWSGQWPGIEFTFEREQGWQPSEDYNLLTSNAVEAIGQQLAVPPHIFRVAE
jgi:hypothetical protein